MLRPPPTVIVPKILEYPNRCEGSLSNKQVDRVFATEKIQDTARRGHVRHLRVVGQHSVVLVDPLVGEGIVVTRAVASLCPGRTARDVKVVADGGRRMVDLRGRCISLRV